jgi:hypothetical protein
MYEIYDVHFFEAQFTPSMRKSKLLHRLRMPFVNSFQGFSKRT